MDDSHPSASGEGRGSGGTENDNSSVVARWLKLWDTDQQVVSSNSVGLTLIYSVILVVTHLPNE